MILRWLLFLWIGGWLAAGFLWAPLVPMLDETTRVLYLHIPCAWLTVVALGWSMIHSIRYLRSRRLEHDDVAAGAAELGILFCIGATLSGSLWAKAAWGSWWNWDPRETSIFFLLLVYGAYLALRSAIDEPHKRARLAAIYSVVAFVTVPFLIFVVPRLYSGLHPDPIINDRGKIDMDPRIRLCFFMLLIGFTFLFYWMLAVRVRLARVERRLLDEAAA